MSADAAPLLDLISGIAGIVTAVRVFSVPTVPLAWMVRELPTRELPATGLAAAA